MTEQVNVNDSWIIDNTTVVPAEGDEGLIQLKITLPAGRELLSDPMKTGQINKVMLQWCGAVRSNILADAAEDQEKAARVARGDDAVAPRPALLQPTEVADTPTSPVAWVRNGHDLALERLDVAREEYVRAQDDFDEWARLYEALGLEDEEEDADEEHSDGRDIPGDSSESDTDSDRTTGASAEDDSEHEESVSGAGESVDETDSSA